MSRARPGSGPGPDAAPRGFVLVNALVMVAALAVVALALLSRAEGGRVRVQATGQAVQLELYLDAYEALAQALLSRDQGAVDHLREAWARDDIALELDRGTVSGQMRDMQAGFNLNWLANAQDEEALAAFDQLLTRLGLAPRVGEEIIAALSPDGMGVTSGQNGRIEENPPGGAALMLEQLPIPERALARLRPHVSVIPGSSQINVNTTSATVLVSFLPDLNPATLDVLLRSRTETPFVSVEDFITRMVEMVGAEQAAALNPDRLSVGSDWFETRITARLEGRVASRLVVLRRFSLPAGAKVAYRLDQW